MPTFPRGHSAFLIRQENARLIARLAPEAARAHSSASFEFPDPVDLRGIPAVGPGISGTMRGSQPENAVTR